MTEFPDLERLAAAQAGLVEALIQDESNEDLGYSNTADVENAGPNEIILNGSFNTHITATIALIRADKHDAEQGIHRVEVDAAAIERVARELWRQRALGTLQPQYKWESLAPEGRDRLIDNARLVITALTVAKP